MQGISTARTLVRKFPYTYANRDENGFDLNIECSLLPCIQVNILNESNGMYLIENEFCRGWTACRNIALCENIPFGDFMTVIDRSITIDGIEYFMSTKIPSEDNSLMLPVYEHGKVTWKKRPAPCGVCRGFLKKSPQTIISQAAKLLGMPYDWGEEHGSVDCSALTKYVYATVGIELPRNSGDQKAFAKSASDTAEMGDIIHVPGHVMIYIDDGFVLHASHSAGKVCISKMPC